MIRIGMICASLFSTILTNKTLTIMTWPSCEMTEDNKINLNKVICTQCKATLMIRPTEKRCPVCGGLLPHADERSWRILSIYTFRQWSENGNIHSWQSLPQVWRHWSAPNKTQFLDAFSTRKQILSLWALWGEVSLCAWASFDQLAIWGGCLAPPHDHNPTSMFDESPRYPGSFSFTHQSPLPSPCQHTEVVLFVTI